MATMLFRRLLIAALAVGAIASRNGVSGSAVDDHGSIQVRAFESVQFNADPYRPDAVPSQSAPNFEPSNAEGKALSSSEQWSAVSSLFYKRTSVSAADMNLACWETNLAYYSKVSADQCRYYGHQSNALNSVYDYTAYPAAKVMIVWVESSYSYTASDILQSLYSSGSTTLNYKVVMKNYLRAFGCDRTYCSRYLNQYSTYNNYIYSHYCFFIYKANFTTTVTGLPYTPGTPCSLCEFYDTCDNNLCRGSYSDLPGIGTCYGSAYVTTTLSRLPTTNSGDGKTGSISIAATAAVLAMLYSLRQSH